MSSYAFPVGQKPESEPLFISTSIDVLTPRIASTPTTSDRSRESSNYSFRSSLRGYRNSRSSIPSLSSFSASLSPHDIRPSLFKISATDKYYAHRTTDQSQIDPLSINSFASHEEDKTEQNKPVIATCSSDDNFSDSNSLNDSSLNENSLNGDGEMPYENEEDVNLCTANTNGLRGSSCQCHMLSFSSSECPEVIAADQCSLSPFSHTDGSLSESSTATFRDSCIRENDSWQQEQHSKSNEDEFEVTLKLNDNEIHHKLPFEHLSLTTRGNLSYLTTKKSQQKEDMFLVSSVQGNNTKTSSNRQISQLSTPCSRNNMSTRDSLLSDTDFTSDEDKDSNAHTFKASDISSFSQAFRGEISDQSSDENKKRSTNLVKKSFSVASLTTQISDKVAICPDSYGGLGLFAIDNIRAGEAVLTDLPVVTCLTDLKHMLIRLVTLNLEEIAVLVGIRTQENTLSQQEESELMSVVSDAKDPEMLNIFRWFVCLMKCNAHGLSHEPTSWGIYPTALRANHSCSPNLWYRNINQELQYIAIRDISKGESLDMAYINHLFASKIFRQTTLSRRKMFICKCPRCSRNGLDPSRLIECPKCRHNSYFEAATLWKLRTQAIDKTTQDLSVIDRPKNSLILKHELNDNGISLSDPNCSTDERPDSEAAYLSSFSLLNPTQYGILNSERLSKHCNDLLDDENRIIGGGNCSDDDGALRYPMFSQFDRSLTTISEKSFEDDETTIDGDLTLSDHYNSNSTIPPNKSWSNSRTISPRFQCVSSPKNVPTPLAKSPPQLVSSYTNSLWLNAATTPESSSLSSEQVAQYPIWPGKNNPIANVACAVPMDSSLSEKDQLSSVAAPGSSQITSSAERTTTQPSEHITSGQTPNTECEVDYNQTLENESVFPDFSSTGASIISSGSSRLNCVEAVAPVLRYFDTSSQNLSHSDLHNLINTSDALPLSLLSSGDGSYLPTPQRGTYPQLYHSILTPLGNNRWVCPRCLHVVTEFDPPLSSEQLLQETYSQLDTDFLQPDQQNWLKKLNHLETSVELSLGRFHWLIAGCNYLYSRFFVNAWYYKQSSEIRNQAFVRAFRYFDFVETYTPESIMIDVVPWSSVLMRLGLVSNDLKSFILLASKYLDSLKILHGLNDPHVTLYQSVWDYLALFNIQNYKSAKSWETSFTDVNFDDDASIFTEKSSETPISLGDIKLKIRSIIESSTLIQVEGLKSGFNFREQDQFILNNEVLVNNPALCSIENFKNRNQQPLSNNSSRSDLDFLTGIRQNDPNVPRSRADVSFFQLHNELIEPLGIIDSSKIQRSVMCPERSQKKLMDMNTFSQIAKSVNTPNKSGVSCHSPVIMPQGDGIMVSDLLMNVDLHGTSPVGEKLKQSDQPHNHNNMKSLGLEKSKVPPLLFYNPDVPKYDTASEAQCCLQAERFARTKGLRYNPCSSVSPSCSRGTATFPLDSARLLQLSNVRHPLVPIFYQDILAQNVTSKFSMDCSDALSDEVEMAKSRVHLALISPELVSVNKLRHRAIQSLRLIPPLLLPRLSQSVLASKLVGQNVSNQCNLENATSEVAIQTSPRPTEVTAVVGKIVDVGIDSTKKHHPFNDGDGRTEELKRICHESKEASSKQLLSRDSRRNRQKSHSKPREETQGELSNLKEKKSKKSERAKLLTCGSGNVKQISQVDGDSAITKTKTHGKESEIPVEANNAMKSSMDPPKGRMLCNEVQMISSQKILDVKKVKLSYNKVSKMRNEVTNKNETTISRNKLSKKTHLEHIHLNSSVKSQSIGNVAKVLDHSFSGNIPKQIFSEHSSSTKLSQNILLNTDLRKTEETVGTNGSPCFDLREKRDGPSGDAIKVPCKPTSEMKSSYLQLDLSTLRMKRASTGPSSTRMQRSLVNPQESLKSQKVEREEALYKSKFKNVSELSSRTGSILTPGLNLNIVKHGIQAINSRRRNIRLRELIDGIQQSSESSILEKPDVCFQSSRSTLINCNKKARRLSTTVEFSVATPVINSSSFTPYGFQSIHAAFVNSNQTTLDIKPVSDLTSITAKKYNSQIIIPQIRNNGNASLPVCYEAPSANSTTSRPSMPLHYATQLVTPLQVQVITQPYTYLEQQLSSQRTSSLVKYKKHGVIPAAVPPAWAAGLRTVAVSTIPNSLISTQSKSSEVKEFNEAPNYPKQDSNQRAISLLSLPTCNHSLRQKQELFDFHERHSMISARHIPKPGLPLIDSPNPERNDRDMIAKVLFRHVLLPMTRTSTSMIPKSKSCKEPTAAAIIESNNASHPDFDVAPWGVPARRTREEASSFSRVLPKLPLTRTQHTHILPTNQNFATRRSNNYCRHKHVTSCSSRLK